MAHLPLLNKPKSVPLSLTPVTVMALDRLARLDGHTNRSAIVRKLVDREAREALGENWDEKIAAVQDAGEAA